MDRILTKKDDVTSVVNLVIGLEIAQIFRQMKKIVVLLVKNQVIWHEIALRNHSVSVDQEEDHLQDDHL